LARRAGAGERLGDARQLAYAMDANCPGYHRPPVAEYRITSWREIPTMVTARDATGATAKVALPDRFQEAVDEAAMRQGLAGSDAYLEGWEQGSWQPAEGSADEVAARIAAELDAAHPAERLAAMLDA
jgi:hypothetical protein